MPRLRKAKLPKFSVLREFLLLILHKFLPRERGRNFYFAKDFLWTKDAVLSLKALTAL